MIIQEKRGAVTGEMRWELNLEMHSFYNSPGRWEEAKPWAENREVGICWNGNMFWLSGYSEWNQKHVSSWNWEWGASIGRMKNTKRRQNCLGEWKSEYISKWDQIIQKFPSCFAISEFIFISLSLKTILAELYGYIMPHY